MNYEKIANEIKNKVGGEENIKAVTHCATRLRINVKDSEKVDFDSIKKISGVVDAVYSNGQVQVVIGTDVPKVYDAFMEIYDVSNSNQSTDEEVTKNKQSAFLN